MTQPNQSEGQSSYQINENDLNSSNHPLFLLQNDHPGLILISKRLSGFENYGVWRRSMMIALNAKNKLKMITGEYQKPLDDA